MLKAVIADRPIGPVPLVVKQLGPFKFCQQIDVKVRLLSF